MPGAAWQSSAEIWGGRGKGAIGPLPEGGRSGDVPRSRSRSGGNGAGSLGTLALETCPFQSRADESLDEDLAEKSQFEINKVGFSFVILFAAFSDTAIPSLRKNLNGMNS